MFPYKDDNPTIHTPAVTLGLIALNLACWVFLQGAGAAEPLARSVCELGLIPGEVLGTVPSGTAVPLGPGMQCVLTAEPAWWTVLTSMFMHGGWFHILGNMWFLWVFGNNIEDSMGHARFVVFYLLCGMAAAAAQAFADPRSAIPMVGASGAIGGVLGGYMVLYPHVRVHTVVTLGFFWTTVALPAYVMLGYWFVLQLMMGTVGALAEARGGVAFWAHVGGFVAGLVLIKLLANRELMEQRQASVEIRRREGGSWR